MFFRRKRRSPPVCIRCVHHIHDDKGSHQCTYGKRRSIIDGRFHDSTSCLKMRTKGECGREGHLYKYNDPCW
jgi:hypothetical protein